MNASKIWNTSIDEADLDDQIQESEVNQGGVCTCMCATVSWRILCIRFLEIFSEVASNSSGCQTWVWLSGVSQRKAVIGLEFGVQRALAWASFGASPCFAMLRHYPCYSSPCHATTYLHWRLSLCLSTKNLLQQLSLITQPECAFGNFGIYQSNPIQRAETATRHDQT